MIGQTETPQVLTLLVSSVTAPLRASARPLVFDPVVSVMLESARMSPVNEVPVPRVAELPTCQKTLLQLLPPLLMTVTDELLAVVSVLPVLNRNSAFALPRASRVRAPVSCADDVKRTAAVQQAKAGVPERWRLAGWLGGGSPLRVNANVLGLASYGGETPPGQPARRQRSGFAALIVKDHVEQRTVHLEAAVVFDESELAEAVHEEVHP